MKKLFIIILLFSFIKVLNAQPNTDYKYKYSFQADPPTDTATISLDSSTTVMNTSKLSIHIQNSNHYPIPFSTIILKAIDTPRTITTLGDNNGNAIAEDLDSSYLLSISAVGYYIFTKRISLNQQSKLWLTITLAQAPSLLIYDIDSKIKLTPTEIQKIKKCATGTEDFFKKCSKKNIYYISIEI